MLKEDFTTISVGAYLVTYDYNLQSTASYLTSFAKSLCQNFSLLQQKGHPKWKEVRLDLPGLNPGWTYYGPTARELRSCMAAKSNGAKAKVCSPEERILGLCN